MSDLLDFANLRFNKSDNFKQEAKEEKFIDLKYFFNFFC